MHPTWNNKDTEPIVGKYEVFIRAEIPPLGMSTYFVKKSTDGKGSVDVEAVVYKTGNGERS